MASNKEQSDFTKTPLAALKIRSRKSLSALNKQRVLPTHDLYPRDYRGLALLAGLSLRNKRIVDQSDDPTNKIIELWIIQDPESSFADLQNILEKIDRYDVLDDSKGFMNEDVKEYLSQKAVTSQNSMEELSLSSLSSETTTEPLETDILTILDSQQFRKKEQLQKYDVLVMYALEDSQFAKTMYDKLKENGYKVCVIVDLIAGIQFKFEAVMRLIQERCHRIIVIMSTAFQKSSQNDFYVKFAQKIGIEEKNRKIIPCVMENCKMPPNLSCMVTLEYNHLDSFFWDRLIASVHNY